MQDRLKKQHSFSLSPQNNTGFTLIEMMIVLVVIGIMASMLSFVIADNPSRQLEREADRLLAILNMAADEALLQGNEYSLAAAEYEDATGYQILSLTLTDNTWQSFNQKPFGFYPLAESISLTVELDEKILIDQQSIGEQIEKLQQVDKNYQPLLILFSSGEITPFELILRHSEVEQAIILHSDGVSGIERI